MLSLRDALDVGAVFHFARFPLYWGTLGRLRRALDLRDGERLLDIGCGTGIGAALVRTPTMRYVGVEPDARYVGFAHARRRDTALQYARMSGTHLGFAARSFDKAVVINVAHHLSDPALDQLLLELCRVVRDRVVLCDWAPDAHNAVSAFLARRDRGAHIRPRPALRRHLERHLTLVEEEVFLNSLRTVAQVVFTLVPGRSAEVS